MSGRGDVVPGREGAVLGGDRRFLALLGVGLGLAVLGAAVGALPAPAAAGVALLLLALGALWRALR